MGLFGWSLPPGCHTLPGEEPEPVQPRCHCGSFLKVQPDEVWSVPRRVKDYGRREVAERRGWLDIKPIETPDFDYGAEWVEGVVIESEQHLAWHCKRCGHYHEVIG